MWLSLDGGNPFTLGTTATYVSPTVVPVGSSSFMVFHTGTNGNIYYTYVYDDGSWSETWYAVPYQSTNNAVSATQMGADSYNVLMMYRGSNNNNVYSTMYVAGNGWQNAEWVSGGTTFASPSVAYNPVSGEVFATIRGEDNQIWMNAIANGQWGSWVGQGFSTYVPPQIAANPQTGSMLVSAVDENTYIPNYRAYNAWGGATGGWSQDITYWQTAFAVTLSYVAAQAAIYAIFTGQNGYCYFKQLFKG